MLKVQISAGKTQRLRMWVKEGETEWSKGRDLLEKEIQTHQYSERSVQILT